MKSVGGDFRKKIPAMAVILAGLFALGSATYALTLVYPSYQAYSRARQTIEEKNRTLENKKQAAVTYAKVRQMPLEPFQIQTQLLLPERVNLPRTNLITATEQLSRIARSHDMDVLGHTVHINGVTEQSRFIAMTVQLKGGWTDFRAYLVDVMALSSFNDLDGLHVYTDKAGIKYYTIDIRLWLEERTS